MSWDLSTSIIIPRVTIVLNLAYTNQTLHKVTWCACKKICRCACNLACTHNYYTNRLQTLIYCYFVHSYYYVLYSQRLFVKDHLLRSHRKLWPSYNHNFTICKSSAIDLSILTMIKMLCLNKSTTDEWELGLFLHKTTIIRWQAEQVRHTVLTSRVFLSTHTWLSPPVHNTHTHLHYSWTIFSPGSSCW